MECDGCASLDIHWVLMHLKEHFRSQNLLTSPLNLLYRVNRLEEGNADRLAFELVVLPVFKIESIGREHARIQVAQNLVLHLALHGAHDSRGEVHDVAEDGELFAGA